MRRIGEGAPEPPGLRCLPGGVNVAIPAPEAERVELCLFSPDGRRELERIALPERTHGIWHGFVPDLGPGTLYGLRAHGPYAPTEGLRFNPNKLLVDPWARALDRPFRLAPSMFGWRLDDPRADLSFDPTDSAPDVPKARLVAPRAATVPRPARPWRETILYELHVKGFTRLHPGVPPALRGTLAGLAHPAALDHLVRLGVTTVELLPITAAIDEPHLVRKGLTNYWGYNPAAFLAVEPRLLASGEVDELAAAIDALHAAGLEVVLDLVLNHTGEGDELGPTFSLRGLDNRTFYRLRPDEPRRYLDPTGCGNSLAVDRPIVLRLVMDALRHWAGLGIDGVRLDLATTLARDARGFAPEGAFLAALRQDPQLAGLELVVEPWDVGPGGYRLGEFPPGVAEWNDRFRDEVRRFWRGDPGHLGRLATRLAGSADTFARGDRRPWASVNFVTAHDGFTLADLVRYARRHNEANGEDGRDGRADEPSWNHGVEGPSADPAIEAARRADMRALLALLLFARGTPMLSMGDELARSQAGNNNAYCQDGPISWLSWELDPAKDALLETVRRLVALRRAHRALHDDRFLTGAPAGGPLPDVTWRRADGAPMAEADWHDPARRFLAVDLCVGTESGTDRVLLLVNREEQPVPAALPRPLVRWWLVLDTAQERPPVPVEIATDRLLCPARAVLLLEDRERPTPLP
ncbi:MAG: glycogen operon protein GlgX homolog [Geminicoccaceae bacterium]|nr:MAG: glycogen operon protein GlgX homolog [Geminicoccaceae bacterium]